MSHERRTIRFEDLGEPVQRLMKSMNREVSEEDMALLEFVSVKDMAKIYGEMSSDRQAEVIWQELRNALEARREKAERKRLDAERRMQEIDDAKAAAEEEDTTAREEEEAARAEEERRRRKEEKRRRKAEERRAAAEAEEAEEQARLEAEAEEQARIEAEEAEAAEEAARKKREKKQRKREARMRELEAEQEALRAEQESAKKNKKKNMKSEWDDYVAQHPLEFAEAEPEIKQVKVERENTVRPPPQASEELLNRSYTPKCPNCQAKFSKPPPEWDCPMCLRRLRKRFKVWMPDDDSANCLICKASIGRFTRHHCRCCGRLICGNCLTGKAIITHLGYKDTPVKICSDCVKTLPEEVRAAAVGEKTPSASPQRSASPDKKAADDI